MERFVQLIVLGGIALVVGLRTVTLFDAPTGPWFVGVAAVGLGLLGLGLGIRRPVQR